MNYEKTQSVKTDICAREGVVTDIDYVANTGTVDLGEELGTVDCTFLYHGQHWIFNRDAYPGSDIQDVSAYAFCVNDLVMVVERADPEGEVGDKVYEVVAALEEDHSAVKKRYLWPPFVPQNGVVYGAYYSEETEGYQYPTFPFVTASTKELVNEYTDSSGNARALGTFAADDTGETHIVITNVDGVYTAHGPHEFMEEDNQFSYVPDVTLQTEPNYRGRTIGLSADDELLMDNIPFAQLDVSALSYTDTLMRSVRRIIHIDEENELVTVLYLLIDYSTRSGYNEFFDETGYLPPAYAFEVYLGQCSTPTCIYDIMQDRIDGVTLPDIVLAQDTDASWPWHEMIGVAIEDFSAGELSGEFVFSYDIHVVYDPTYFDVAYAGKDIEVSLYASLPYEEWISDPDDDTGWADFYKADFRQKIFRLTTAPDGTYYVSHEDGERIRPFNDLSYTYESESNYGGYSGLTRQAVTVFAGEGDIDCIVFKDGVNELRKQIQVDSTFQKICGTVNSYEHGEFDYELDLKEIYTHTDEFGTFEICRAESAIIGTNRFLEETAEYSKSAYGQMQFVVFTNIDLKRGIYTYVIHQPFKDVDMATWYPNSDNVYPSAPDVYKWYHYITDRNGTVLVNEGAGAYPTGDRDTMGTANADTTDALLNLISNPPYPLTLTYCVDGYGWAPDGENYMNIVWPTKTVFNRMVGVDCSDIVDWGWNTTNSSYGDWPDYYHSHFYFYNYNIGNPHRGSSVLTSSAEAPCANAILFSSGAYRDGTEVPHGYTYLYYMRCNDYASYDTYELNSPGLDDLLTCTGRDDLVLENT